MKIRRITDFQKQFTFHNIDDTLDKHLLVFHQTDLGKISAALPWQELVMVFRLSPKPKGPASIFSPRGKVALMFLKHYAGCSDRKLIDQFNGNIHYQIFCDTILAPGEFLTNYKIVSQIRCEIAENLVIDDLEKVLIKKWLPYMDNLDSITCDATCYESSIRYPTDVKLLWESVLWTYGQINKTIKENKKRMPRTKYKKWLRRYISYSKMRRKTKKKRRSLTRGLLRLLSKLDGELKLLEQSHPEIRSRRGYAERRQAITIVLEQQGLKFHEGIRPKGAIVSIGKPYLRPIIRGKEVKPVEFGAKVHKLQIDGISFLEHLSFDAFNEGTRIKQTLYKAQSLTHTQTKVLGADAIYATNANRCLLTSKGIRTDFKPKGRPGKHHKHKNQIAKMITKERVSRLEGSFGTDKEYFLLKKIKARTEKTERLWIFFGIHTSNALSIGKRICNSRKIAA